MLQEKMEKQEFGIGRQPDSVCLEEYIQDEIRPFRDADAIEGQDCEI